MDYEIICATCGEKIEDNSAYVSRKDKDLIFYHVGNPPSPSHICVTTAGKDIDGGILGMDEVERLLSCDNK